MQVAPTVPSRSTRSCGLGTNFDLDGALITSTGDISHCLNAGGMGRQDYETETLIAHSLSADGFDASEDGTGLGTPLVTAFVCQSCGESFSDPHAVGVGGLSPAECPRCGEEKRVIAFSAKDHGADAGETAPTLRAGGFDRSHANAGVMPAVAYAIQERAVCENPDAGPDGAGFRDDGTSYTLESRTVPQAVCYGIDEEQNATEDGFGCLKFREKGGGFEGAVAISANQRGEVREREVYGSLNGSKSGKQFDGFRTASAVRRLTPRECERLQGFPDDYTLVPFRGKSAADGPRYKALGNSMAVPVMRWIGERIQMVEAL